MTDRADTWRSDRGAILVHTAVALIGLMAFSAFAIDYGLLWTSRRQAQNAADAGALAGAMALAFDDQTDTTGIVKANAHEVAVKNFIWGEAGTNDADTDVLSPATGYKCPDDASASCVRVNVYRTSARGSALPAFFGNLFGVTSQDIQAMAVGKASTADTTKCLRPFAVPDKWIDNGDGVYNGGDTYIPPTEQETTGYTQDDIGTPVHFKGMPGDPPTLDNGWFRLIDLYGSGGGGTNETRAAIATCSGDTYGVGDTIPNEENGEENGAKSALADLYNLDPDATWDDGQKKIVNTCVDSHTCEHYVLDAPDSFKYHAEVDPTMTASPRVIDLPVFNPQIQQATGDLVITNIWEFFLVKCDGSTGPAKDNDFKEVCGVLVNKVDPTAHGSGSLEPGTGFITTVSLIR